MGFGTWFMKKRNANTCILFIIWNLGQKIWDKKNSCKCNQCSCNLHANIICHLCHTNLVYLLAKLIIL